MSTTSTVAEVVSGYAEHLRSRDVSEHTARAYVSDITDFLDHAGHSTKMRRGTGDGEQAEQQGSPQNQGPRVDVSAIDLDDLRSWLIALDDAGAARAAGARKVAAARAARGSPRSPVARAVSAVRSFCASGVSSLGLTNSPAARLRTPKKESRLPTVLKPQQAAELTAAAEVAASDGAEAGGSSAGTR